MSIKQSLLLLSKRQQAILDLLADMKVVRVMELADKFNVDAMTIRRDLNHLQKLGLLIRMHGECRLSTRGTFDLAFKEYEGFLGFPCGCGTGQIPTMKLTTADVIVVIVGNHVGEFPKTPDGVT